MPLPGVGRPGSLSSLFWLNSTWRTTLCLCQIPTGIQLDRVLRPRWIQCIVLLVSAEVKNHVCSVQAPDPSAGPWLSVCTWCSLCFCEELLASIDRGAPDWGCWGCLGCRCQLQLFCFRIHSYWHNLRVYQCCTCQRAQSWGNRGARWLLVSFSLKKLNDCRSLTGICWAENTIRVFFSSAWPHPALGLTWTICSWVRSAEGVFKA